LCLFVFVLVLVYFIVSINIFPCVVIKYIYNAKSDTMYIGHHE